MTLALDDVTLLATAIAKSNGHPSPATWAAEVVANLTAPVVQEVAPAPVIEPTPNETDASAPVVQEGA